MNIEKLEPGMKYEIHAYKHDGNIHRTWDEAVLLEIHDDYLIFGNEKTKVTESDGRTWRTKEPAVLFFFYKDWYNIIGQNKHDENNINQNTSFQAFKSHYSQGYYWERKNV